MSYLRIPVACLGSDSRDVNYNEAIHLGHRGCILGLHRPHKDLYSMFLQADDEPIHIQDFSLLDLGLDHIRHYLLLRIHVYDYFLLFTDRRILALF